MSPSPGDVAAREPFDHARLVDLEAAQESPFLRGQKRVSVRRGSLPKKTAHRLMWVALALISLAILSAAALRLYRYGKHSWRFRIASSDQIEVSGADHVTHAQIMEVMGGDIGRNIFFVPLVERQQQLEQIPWVESASVMRFVPNRLRIEIHERTPVAFARIGSHISLIDAGGTLMDLAPGGKHKYSFPVIAGMNAGEPLSTRAARIKNYNALVRDLDSGGAHYSQELSEVDLSDPDDVKVLAAGSNGIAVVHLGAGNYLQRYKVYVTHVQQWRQQFDKLESVDLRYDGQIIVNPDLTGLARQPALTAAAAKAAVAAGVKTSAIVNYEKYAVPPSPAPAAKKETKTKGKAAAKGVAQHAAAHRVAVKSVAVKPAAAKPAAAQSAAAKPSAVPPASVNQTALQPPPKAAPATGSAATSHQPAGQASTAATQKKPSAAIPKETQQN